MLLNDLGVEHRVSVTGGQLVRRVHQGRGWGSGRPTLARYAAREPGSTGERVIHDGFP